MGHPNLVGIGFAAASGVSWGNYILLTQRLGAQLPGLQGLAISLSTAIVIAPLGVVTAARGLSVPVAAQGLGIAISVPLLPFAMLALRRMRVAAFGTLWRWSPGSRPCSVCSS